MEDMVMNRAFWKGKSVFLTGHTGFKGSWFSLWLQHLGACVSGYALAPESGECLYHQARVGERLHTTYGDVRDGERLHTAITWAKPEIALHFAAQPLVRASYQNPAYTFAVNVMGTVNFLEAIRRTPSVRVAVVVTSDKCYENREWRRGYRESDRMGGSDPYSCSKGCAELVTSAYRRSFFENGRVAVATVRAGNVMGGGDWAEDRLVPDLVRAFAGGRMVKLRYPKAVRPWQYVLDPLRGYMMLVQHLWQAGATYSTAWNFGPGDEAAFTVEDVVREAAGRWGPGASWDVDRSSQPRESQHLKLDCSQACSQLGWIPLFELETALDWTLSWYLAHHSGNADMRAFSQAQIAAYEDLLAVAPGQTKSCRRRSA